MMEDSDLARIRAQRLAELRKNNSTTAAPTTRNNPMGASEEEEAKKQQMEEMRRNMLAQILTNEARERLNRISLVKVERARAVENLIINMARSGELRSRLSEEQLVDLLEKLNQQQQSAEPKVVVQRRRAAESDDDDEDYGF